MAISGEIVKVEYYDPATDTFVDVPPMLSVDQYCGVRAKVKNTGDAATATIQTRIINPGGAVVFEPAAQTFDLASGEEKYTMSVLKTADAPGDWSAEIVFKLNTTEVDKWAGKIATAVAPVVPLTEMMMMVMMVLIVALILKGFKQLI